MKRINYLVLIITLTLLVSCSDSETKIKTGDNYKEIILPDGSSAHLNKHSSIEYDESFESREIIQTGEVFYEVKEGETPFIVKTEKGDIEVLGTRFNVNSSKHALEVQVEKGSVEFRAGGIIKVIKKGNKGFYKGFKKGIQIGRADFKYKKWKKNLGKEIKKVSKQVDKGKGHFKEDSKNLGPGLKKEVKKFKKHK